MDLFIGIKIKDDSVHCSKIKSFKERHDLKFVKEKIIQLTLVPTFEFNSNKNEDYFNFQNELVEILESHFFGVDEIRFLEFNGINFSLGKKSLFLTPIFSPDFIYCQDSIAHFLKKEGISFKKNKSISQPMLPIGRFDYELQLENAIDVAKLEFSSPFVLEADSIVLFEKTPKEWIPRVNLFTFEQKDSFLVEANKYA